MDRPSSPYYYNIVYYEKHNIRRTSISRVNKPDPHDAATASAPPTAAPTVKIATIMPLLLLLVVVLLWCVVVGYTVGVVVVLLLCGGDMLR